MRTHRQGFPTVCRGAAVACVPVVERERSPYTSVGCIWYMYACAVVIWRGQSPCTVIGRTTLHYAFLIESLTIFLRGCRVRYPKTAKLSRRRSQIKQSKWERRKDKTTSSGAGHSRGAGGAERCQYELRIKAIWEGIPTWRATTEATSSHLGFAPDQPIRKLPNTVPSGYE